MRTVTKSTLIRIRTGGAQTLLLSMTLFFTTSVMQANAAELFNPEEKVETQPNLIAIQQNAIDDMRQRLQRLEQRGQQGEDHGVPTSAETAEDTRPQFGVNLGVFGDINYSSKNREREHQAFSIGDLDFYSTAEYGARINLLAELLLELEEGGENILDLERLWVGYTFSDLLILRAGKQHSALGYWNKTYHHGKQLFLTIDRPFFLAFEDDGGILPVHIVGIELEGAKSFAGMRWKYEMSLGNGPMIDTVGKVLIPNNTSDNNTGKAVGFHAAISPAVMENLKVGVSGHFARVKDDTATAPVMKDVDQAVYVAAVMYSPGNVNISGEYFAIGNKSESDKKYNSNAYFGLITYALTEKWVPYLLYDNMSIKKDDPYFKALKTKDVTKTTLGLRYNISYRSSVKGEVRAVEKDNNDWNEFALQWALAF